jgi:hypothetical protein
MNAILPVPAAYYLRELCDETVGYRNDELMVHKTT